MTKKKNQHIIWSNKNLDYDDWKADIEADYPDMDEDKRKEMMYEINNDYLDAERSNLNIPLSRPILVIADLGLWNGRFSGYKEIGKNISDCLYSNFDYSTWTVDEKGDLCCEAIHHDGTNYYVYRTYKDSATEEQIENLKSKIYEGTATRKDITKITRRLGDNIGNVYGWAFPGRKRKEKEAV